MYLKKNGMNIYFSKRSKFKWGYDDILHGMNVLRRDNKSENFLNIKEDNFYRWEYKLKPFLKEVLVEYKLEDKKWIKLREI